MPSPKIPSAALLARRGAQIQWNKDAIDALQMGMADGLVELGSKIIDDASKGPGGSGVGSLRDPELAAAEGRPMMLDTGTISVWALGKLVVGGTENAASAYKPKVRTGTKINAAGQERGTYRAMAVPKDQVVLFVGFASPLSHLAELGTINEPARPFLIPSFNRNISGVASVIVPAMGKRVKGVPASLWSPAPSAPRASR